MTVGSEIAKSGPYAGNGSTTEFAVTFKFYDNSHLSVHLYDDSDESATLVDPADYTVTGAGEESGGAVTFDTAPATGLDVVILRDVPLTQETDLVDNGPFLPEVVERRFDLVVQICQQLKEITDRAVVVPPGSDMDPAEVLAEITADLAAAEAAAIAAAASAISSASSAATALEAADRAEAAAALFGRTYEELKGSRTAAATDKSKLLKVEGSKGLYIDVDTGMTGAFAVGNQIWMFAQDAEADLYVSGVVNFNGPSSGNPIPDTYTIPQGAMGIATYVGTDTWQFGVVRPDAAALANHAHNGVDGTEKISYNNLLNVPTEFTPGSHTQAISTITGLETALGLLAPKSSPAFTGTPTVPTASAGTSTTQAASTAFVAAEIANKVPETVSVITGNAQTDSEDNTATVTVAQLTDEESNSILMIDIDVVGMDSDGTRMAAYKRTGVFTYTSVSDGGMVQRGGTIDAAGVETSAGYNAAFTVRNDGTGGYVDVTVTGSSTATMKWSVSAKLIYKRYATWTA